VRVEAVAERPHMLSLSPRLSPVSHGRIDTRARAGLERPGRATAAAVVTAARATSPMGKKRRAVASSSRAFEVVEEGVVPPLPPLHEFSSSIADGPAPDPDDAPSKRARVAGPPPRDGTEDGRWNLAAVVRASFPDRFPTIASAKKSVRRGEVRVSGEVRRPDYRPAPGEPIAVVQRTAASAKMNLEDLPANLPRLRVAYEDAHAAIVVKPEGIPTVGNAERGNGWTAERMLPYFLTPATGVDGALARPRPAHRLDAATGGLLVVAKTRRALASLCLAFENRTPRKRYRALLCGDAGTNAADAVGGDDENASSPGNVSASHPGASVITLPLSGQPCETHWRSVAVVPSERYGALTLVDMWPKTGRTHQLRRHASEALRRPIVGDARYTKGETKGGLDDSRGLFLWAVELNLPARAMPWREEDGGTAEDGGTRGGGAGAGANELVGSRETVTAAEVGMKEGDPDERWLRVRIDDPEKFAARMGGAIVER